MERSSNLPIVMQIVNARAESQTQAIQASHPAFLLCELVGVLREMPEEKRCEVFVDAN